MRAFRLVVFFVAIACSRFTPTAPERNGPVTGNWRGDAAGYVITLRLHDDDVWPSQLSGSGFYENAQSADTQRFVVQGGRHLFPEAANWTVFMNWHDVHPRRDVASYSGTLVDDSTIVGGFDPWSPFLPGVELTFTKQPRGP